MYCFAWCLLERLDLNGVLNLSDFHLSCSFSTLIAAGVFECLKELRWHIQESAFKLAGGPIILFPAIRQHTSSSSSSRASANMFSLSFSSRMSQPRPASHFPDFSVNLTMTSYQKNPYQCLALTPNYLDLLFVYPVPRATIGQFARGRRNKFTASSANHVDLANLSSEGHWIGKACCPIWN